MLLFNPKSPANPKSLVAHPTFWKPLLVAASAVVLCLTLPLQAQIASPIQDVTPTSQVENPAPNARLEFKRADAALVDKGRFGTKMTPEAEADLVGRNAQALKILRGALQMKFEARPLDPILGTAAPFESLAGYRWMARLLASESRVRTRGGDFVGAADSCMDALRMAHKFQVDGTIIATLVGQAIEGIGRAALREVLPKLDAATCQNLAREMESLEKTRRNWGQVIDSDSQIYRIEARKFVAGFSPGEDGQLQADAHFDGLMEPQLAQAQTPYLLSEQRVLEPDAGEGFPQNNDEFDAALKGKDISGIVEVLFKMSSSSFSSARFSFERNRAASLLLKTQLALHAFELENKRSARTLDELVPKYLQRVPLDPFGVDETLQWKERGGKWLLYSIGPDGIDNGGIAGPTNPPFSVMGVKRPVMESNSLGDIVAGVTVP